MIVRRAGVEDAEAVAALWVLAGNGRALGFYARHGWAPDGSRRQEPMAGVPLEAVSYRR